MGPTGSATSSRPPSLLTGLLTLLAFASSLPAALPEHLSSERIDRRIQQHRIGELTLTVLDAAGKPLRDADVVIEMKAHKFLFGCNIYAFGKCGSDELEQAYRSGFRELLNFATIGFYWSSYERRRGQTNAEYAAQVADWCRENSIRTKGHPLCWHLTTPAWLAGLSDEQVEQIQFARIEREIAQFRGRIDTWDVLNEAIVMPDHQGGKNPVAVLCRRLGQAGLITRCFEVARRTNPRATLLLNDFRLDPAYEKLIRQCLDAGVTIDAIGLQSHMHGGYWGAERTWEVCERFAKFGKPLHFTEATIVSGPRTRDAQRTNNRSAGWETTPEGEAKQAEQAVEFYRVLFSHPAVHAITWWDFSDLRAWQAAPAGLLRKDMSPKPVYTQLKDLIRRQWWTAPQRLKTDAVGRVTFRGFLGRYEITAGPLRATVELDKAAPNAQQVQLAPG